MLRLLNTTMGKWQNTISNWPRLLCTYTYSGVALCKRMHHMMQQMLQIVAAASWFIGFAVDRSVASRYSDTSRTNTLKHAANQLSAAELTAEIVANCIGFGGRECLSAFNRHFTQPHFHSADIGWFRWCVGGNEHQNLVHYRQLWLCPPALSFRSFDCTEVEERRNIIQLAISIYR